MTDPYAQRRFRQIDTTAKLPGGQVFETSNKYPKGVGKDVYDQIDKDLVAKYGNENCRTTGHFMNSDEGCLKSDRTRRDGGMPLPCIVCKKQLDSAANDPSFDHVPYAGTMFVTNGHYGSTVFDNMDGQALQIVVCDTCLTAKPRELVTFVDTDKSRRPWDGREG